MEPNRTAPIDSPRFAAALAGRVEGDLACLSAFELLQVLQWLGKVGRLEMQNRSGEEASCRIQARGLAEVRCGQLRDREAAMALAWWKDGTFRFDPSALGDEGPGAASPPLAVQEVLLDAVRLADEIEARHNLMPDRGEPLHLLLSQGLPASLRGIAGAEQIAGALASRPGASRLDLEASLALAPVTLGFALARLCEEGFVGTHELRSSPPETARSPALAAGKRRILRALFAFDRDFADDVDPALRRIQAELGAEPSPGRVDASAPAFLRSRLPSDCFLSITALPISRRNRFVLESLTPTLELAILLISDHTRGEVEHWLSLGAPGAAVLVARAADVAVAEAVAALRRLEGEEGS